MQQRTEQPAKNPRGKWVWIIASLVIIAILLASNLFFKGTIIVGGPVPPAMPSQQTAQQPVTPTPPAPAISQQASPPIPSAPTPPVTYQNVVTRGEILAVLQGAFPSATQSVSRNSYNLYSMTQFKEFMRQEYINGNYSRFVRRTGNSTVYDACGAADQLIASANTKLSGIPVGLATLNDKTRTYFVSVFRGSQGLELLSFAPLDGKALNNDTRMQIVAIR